MTSCRRQPYIYFESSKFQLSNVKYNRRETLTDDGRPGMGTRCLRSARGSTGHLVLATVRCRSQLTGVNLMLFSLLHNPCSTTIYTIYRETRSAKWTTLAALLPVVMGLAVCFLVTQVWRLLAS